MKLYVIVSGDFTTFGLGCSLSKTEIERKKEQMNKELQPWEEIWIEEYEVEETNYVDFNKQKGKLKMWNVFENKFVHNDIQVETCLIVLGVVNKDYASIEAQELYTMLTPIEIAEIKRRFRNG